MGFITKRVIINTNNYNGFRVRFGVRRRHRGPPFALAYHQFIIIVAIQDEEEGEGGYTSRIGYSMYLSGFLQNTMVAKGVFLTRKETRARLGRIEVGGGENSKWMGRQTKKRQRANNKETTKSKQEMHWAYKRDVAEK